NVAPAPPTVIVSLHNDRVSVSMQGGPNTGTATITATIYASQLAPVSCAMDSDCAKTSTPTGTCHNGACVLKASSSFVVQTVAPELPLCKGTASNPALKGGDPALVLGAASISLPEGANAPNQGSFLWSVAPFAATIDCGDTAPPNGYVPLGPPVTFGPASLAFQREIPLAVPINPALMPTTAYLRHVRVAYSGPAFQAPRVIPVADMHSAQVSATEWALTFKAPRLGTYQAVIAPDAGTHTFTRKMAHRGVVGVSMGGGG